MTNHKNRLAKLEADQLPAQGTRTVVMYEHEHTPEEIEAARQDATIGTLIIVTYQDANPDKPLSEVNWNGEPIKRIGIDMGKL